MRQRPIDLILWSSPTAHPKHPNSCSFSTILYVGRTALFRTTANTAALFGTPLSDLGCPIIVLIVVLKACRCSTPHGKLYLYVLLSAHRSGSGGGRPDVLEGPWEGGGGGGTEVNNSACPLRSREGAARNRITASPPLSACAPREGEGRRQLQLLHQRLVYPLRAQ